MFSEPFLYSEHFRRLSRKCLESNLKNFGIVFPKLKSSGTGEQFDWKFVFENIFFWFFTLFDSKKKTEACGGKKSARFSEVSSTCTKDHSRENKLHGKKIFKRCWISKVNIFRVSQKNLSRLSKPHSACTEEHIEWFFWKNCTRVLLFGSLSENFSHFRQFFRGGLSKLQSTCAEKRSEQNWKPGKKTCLYFAFSDRKRKMIGLLAEKVQHGCQNYILRVQTIILRRKSNARRIHIFNNISGHRAEKVLIFDEFFMHYCPNCVCSLQSSIPIVFWRHSLFFYKKNSIWAGNVWNSAQKFWHCIQKMHSSCTDQYLEHKLASRKKLLLWSLLDFKQKNSNLCGEKQAGFPELNSLCTEDHC